MAARRTLALIEMIFAQVVTKAGNRQQTSARESCGHGDHDRRRRAAVLEPTDRRSGVVAQFAGKRKKTFSAPVDNVSIVTSKRSPKALMTSLTSTPR